MPTTADIDAAETYLVYAEEQMTLARELMEASHRHLAASKEANRHARELLGTGAS